MHPDKEHEGDAPESTLKQRTVTGRSRFGRQSCDAATLATYRTLDERRERQQTHCAQNKVARNDFRLAKEERPSDGSARWCSTQPQRQCPPAGEIFGTRKVRKTLNQAVWNSRAGAFITSTKSASF
jgi:hypothetical protein